MFLNRESIAGTWQAFERLVCRYLIYRGYQGVRIVGASGDKGADIIAHKHSQRWLFQVKRWKRPAGVKVVEETIKALQIYDASIPVVVCWGGFDKSVYKFRGNVLPQTACQLWDSKKLIDMVSNLDASAYPPNAEQYHSLRPYQERAVKMLIENFYSADEHQGMIVMATGLGKTRVMCEFIRRLSQSDNSAIKVLVMAHSNDIVYQLEKSFWPHLRTDQQTIVWNGLEKQTLDLLNRADLVFACLNTVAQHVKVGGELPDFDLIVVDECHHVGDEGMYSEVLDELLAGKQGGPFLTGVTATPWRPDEFDLSRRFGDPLMQMDIVAGLKGGFLSNIDYRMFTTNLDWSKFGNKKIKGKKLSPKGINRTIFISEWDEGVVDEIEKVWNEQLHPRAIVFCGTVKHAIMMREKINARRFCRAEAVFSGTGRYEKQRIYERNRIISDFQIGKIEVMCCVDIFNEGIDVPDVNIVVFQRVTHSRRIFVQQLGRGLRLAERKEKVIVLDFVSDIRRFAAGIELKDSLKIAGGGVPIRLNHKVDFYRHGGLDERAESFLREWLEDITSVENMGENVAELKYPPVWEE